MPKRTLAFSSALLLVAAAAFAAQERPRTWIEHVRFHTLRTLQSLGRELDAAVVAVRSNAAGLKSDVAQGLASVTTEGRRGLDHASRAVSATTARAFRDTHDTFLSAGRTLVPGVASQPKAKTPVASDRLVDSPMLAPHFLRGNDILLAWHLDTGEHPFRRSVVLSDRLILETDGLDLFSFEPRTGVLHWLYSLPGPSNGTYDSDEDAIFLIAKDVYYEIDRMVGRPRRRFALTFPASNPPAVHGNEVIINSWERRVIALNRETRVREWAFVPNDNVVAAVRAQNELVYVPDLAGNLVGYSTTGRQARWTYEAHDAFRVTPVLGLTSIILPADDFFVHCVNRFSGLAHWKYPVQGLVTQPVWLEERAVYFAADGDAFYAVEPKEGKLIWRVPKGGWPVAVGQDNLYLQGAGKEIWCIDRKTGEKKWAVSAEPFTYFVRNTVSDHIFLGTDDGQIYAFYLRGDHLEKKAPPSLEKGKEHEAPGGIEPREPGAKEDTEHAAPKPKMPAPKGLRPPAKNAEAPAEEPKEEPKEQPKAEETPPAAKDAPRVNPNTPAGEKTPAELEEEEAAKKKE